MLYLYCFTLWMRLHPFYVSVTEIKENPKLKIIEISHRIFTDDLEKTLKYAQLGSYDLGKPRDKNLASKAIDQYISHHFYLILNGKRQIPEFVGYEIEEDGCWNYYQIKLDASPVKSLIIHDALLFEMHKEQINLVSLESKGEKKSTKLENPKADYTFY